MTAEYEISLDETPSAEDLQTLRESYDAFTETQIGEEDRQEIVFFVRDHEGSVLGGVKGVYSNYGWLWIDLLWVSEEFRGKGYGVKLMKKIEQEAKRSGCTNAYLNSFSFQGVEFYKKLGYRVYGELHDFPVGHSVCAMTKELAKRDVE